MSIAITDKSTTVVGVNQYHGAGMWYRVAVKF